MKLKGREKGEVENEMKSAKERRLIRKGKTTTTARKIRKDKGKEGKEKGK